MRIITLSQGSWTLNESYAWKTALLAIFFLYIALRVFAWDHTTLVEDHDSIGYLSATQIFLSANIGEAFLQQSPDGTPLYPLTSALLSLPGWSVEFGARLCSLVFSMVLFLAILGIGKLIAKPLEIVIGLLFLSISPILVPLSYSVLTEPSYIAIVYLGLWIFWKQYRTPTLWTGCLLGVVFGLSFLDRTEGIFYLGLIPFFQGVHFFFGERKAYEGKRFVQWVLLFVIGFSIMAGPQIARVSLQMGQLAINGRQVWVQILNNPDGKSYEEKIYGLDYSEDQINLFFLQSHAEAASQLKTSVGPLAYLKTVVRNSLALYENELGVLVGPLGLILFALGLLRLYQSGRHYECLLVMIFIAGSLVAPFFHNVSLRHIAVILPIILLIEGIGVTHLAKKISKFSPKAHAKEIGICMIIVVTMVGITTPQLWLSIDMLDHRNKEYSLSILERPISIIREFVQNNPKTDVSVIARKRYLPYFAEVNLVRTPYTNYEGLVKYCEANNVDFLFLQYRLIAEHPFLKKFEGDLPPEDFHLVYSTYDKFDKKVELYQYSPRGVKEFS